MVIDVLTYGVINSRLLTANCVVASQAEELILEEKKGFKCTDKWFGVQLQLALIYAIKNYGIIIPDVSARSNYSTAAWTGGSATFNFSISLNFTIGGQSSVVVVGQSSITGALTALVIAINTLAGKTICAYDSVGKIFTFIAPSGGAASNSYSYFFTAIGGGSPSIPFVPGTFSGGSTGNYNTTFNDTTTCLKTQGVKNILEKLSIFGSC